MKSARKLCLASCYSESLVFAWAHTTSAEHTEKCDWTPNFKIIWNFLSHTHTYTHTKAHTSPFLTMQQSKSQPAEHDPSLAPSLTPRAPLCCPIRRPCSIESARLLGAPWWLPGWACCGPICCNLPGPLLPQMWWLRALCVWNSWWDKEQEREKKREYGT